MGSGSCTHVPPFRHGRMLQALPTEMKYGHKHGVSDQGLYICLKKTKNTLKRGTHPVKEYFDAVISVSPCHIISVYVVLGPSDCNYEPVIWQIAFILSEHGLTCHVLSVFSLMQSSVSIATPSGNVLSMLSN